MLLIDRDAEIRSRLADEIERDGRYRTIGLDGLDALETGGAHVLLDLTGIALAIIALDSLPVPVELERLAGLPVLALVPAGSPPVEQAAATVSKPLKLSILLDTIAQVLEAPTVIQLGPCRLDLRLKQLAARAGGREGWVIRLTEKEAAILHCLYRANHAIVPREQLLQDVWGYSQAVTTHTVETHIYRLRRKIEIQPELAGLLATEPGGYRLVAIRA